MTPSTQWRCSANARESKTSRAPFPSPFGLKERRITCRVTIWIKGPPQAGALDRFVGRPALLAMIDNAEAYALQRVR